MIDHNCITEHPAADILAAFVEKSLSVHERATVLNHVADCSHCREVLFLVHESTIQEEPALTLAAKKVPQPAWLNWRVGLVSACLLVTVGVLTQKIYQRMHQSEST